MEISSALKQEAQFIKGDIEDKETWSKIASVSKGRVLLVCIEVLEHLDNPHNFWKNAKALNPSQVIVSLPIGLKIPSHNSSFENKSGAVKYLEKYLKIKELQLIKPFIKSERNIDEYSILIAMGELR